MGSTIWKGALHFEEESIPSSHYRKEGHCNGHGG